MDSRINHQAMKDWVDPLMFLYKKSPNHKGSDRLQFKYFANQYLRRLYNEVISVSGDFESYNVFLWNEICTAAGSVNGKAQIFIDFGKYESLPSSAFHIDNPDLELFIEPIKYLYKKFARHTRSLRRNKVTPISHTNDIDPLSYLDNNNVNDPLLGSAEELIVITHPVAVQSKIGTPNFDREVKKTLTYCIQHGLTWITSGQLATYFRVDQRNFEKWADNNPGLRCREGVEPGVFYYCLTPLEDLEMATNKTSDAAQEAAATAVADPDNNSTAKGAPASAAEASTDAAIQAVAAGGEPLAIIKPPQDVEDDSFEQSVTQFLNESEKMWRSSESIATKFGLDKASVESWLETHSAFIRRPSSKQNDDIIYFGLNSRADDRKSALAAATAAQANKATQTPASTNGATTTAKAKKAEEAKKKKQRSSITQKELLSFGAMYAVRNQLVHTMAFYANCIATRHPEAFAHLTQAEKELDSGLALLKNSIKIDDKRLPPCEEL